MVTVTAKK